MFERPVRFLLALTATAMLAAGCGGSSGDEAGPTDPASTAGSSTDVDGGEDEPDASDRAAEAPDDEPAGAFPVTVEHAFGTTVVESEPERVLTYGFADHSFALAVGVVPIGLRKTFDDQPFIVWPWAQESLGGAEPELIGFLEPSFEQIAALQPDVILAINADIDQRVYDILSAIAPTVTRSAEYDIQGTPWREATELTGRVLGRSDEAASVVDDLDARFADAIATNPAFVDSTVSISYYGAASGRFGSYEPDNNRYQFLGELGFVPPPALLEVATLEGTVVELGLERIDVIDADVVIWNPTEDGGADEIRAIATREAALPAAGEGREVIADLLLAAALTEASPLSWGYALDRLIPELGAAIDGDLSTPAPSAVALYELAVGAATADEQAAMDAWAIALGSDADLDAKRPHIEDFDSLVSVIDEAIAAGEALGGVTVTPTQATITGDTATVLFDAGVGGAVTADLGATLDRVDGVWVARRAEICLYIGFIGVECP
ncbi:MAG: ABC transporter substrate-binding protein [Actinomycetota bacterium]